MVIFDVLGYISDELFRLERSKCRLVNVRIGLRVPFPVLDGPSDGGLQLNRDWFSFHRETYSEYVFDRSINLLA